MESIGSDEDLAAAATEAGVLLQCIHDYLQRRPHPAGRVRFPRGYISTANAGRGRLHFVADDVLCTNLAYALMSADVIRWLLHRTDIAATAQEMVIKVGLVVYAAVVEGVVWNATSSTMGGRQRFRSRTKWLVEHSRIDMTCCSEIGWLWDRRNSQHLHGLKSREIDHYSLEHFDRAERAVSMLLAQLANAGPRQLSG